MVFTRFVEVGRVAMINYGEDAGKLCTIVNVLDLSHVMVEGPATVTGVQRQTISLGRLSLTDLKVPIEFGARAGTVAKALKAGQVVEKFAASALGKKLAIQKARATATDFDRFKIMVARKTKAREVRKLTKKPVKAAAAKKA